MGTTLFKTRNVKLYTLLKTEDPANDTLTVGTSLYRKYRGGGGGALFIEWGCAAEHCETLTE